MISEPQFVAPPPAVASEPVLEMDAAPRRAFADVSVLIVTWNSETWIERCLRALPAACAGLAYEVILHDNRSTDGTLAVARTTAHDHLSIVEGEANHGFAGGINRALTRASGRYVFFLNPDCEPAAGSIRALVEHLDRSPAIAAAVPLLLGEDGRPQREFQLRRFPSLKSLAAEILLFDKLFPTNAASASYRYRDLDISSVQQVDQPAGAAFLVRREVAEAIGPLDERFFPAWFEDVDYCRRMMEQRFAIHLVPAARATHRGGASLDHVAFSDFLSIWYRNLFRYATKWLSRAEVEKIRWMIISGMLLRTAATLTGLGRSAGGRLMTGAAYLRVAREAIDRWDDAYRSS